MGAGKTSTGEILSRVLGRPFVDTDRQIEKKACSSIVDIFRFKGEDYFRRMEKSIILEECRSGSKVISLGGGAFLDQENRDACLSGRNKVIFLNASWEHIRQSIETMKKDRPLLMNKNEEEMRALFELRQSAYKQAHIEVLVHHFDTYEAVAAHIARLLKPSNGGIS